MSKKHERSVVPGSPEWWLSRAPREEKSGGRGRPSVPFDKILTTALEAVDEVGVQAFNMRMLAERLESGTATLYRHFASKDEILTYLVDRVLGELQTGKTSAGKTWQQACTAIAEELYRVLSAHPNIVSLLVSQIPVGPNGLRLREHGLAVLLANGFSPRLASRAYATLAHYVLGFAIQRHASGPTADDADFVHFFRRLDPKAYPATLKVAPYLSDIPLDEEFRFGLKLIIDGLDAARQPRRDRVRSSRVTEAER